MSRKYKFRDTNRHYLVTFTVTKWIDVLIGDQYKRNFNETGRNSPSKIAKEYLVGDG